MDGCDPDVVDDCPLHVGSTAVGTMSLEATGDIAALDCQLAGKINGMPPALPLACPVDDGCQSLAGNATCPIKSGSKFVYNVEIAAQSFFPAVRVVSILCYIHFN